MPEPKMDQMGMKPAPEQKKQEEYRPATFKIEKSGNGLGTTTDGLAGRIISLEQNNAAFKEALEVLDASDKWFPVEAETQDEVDKKALELKEKLEDPKWQKQIMESAKSVSQMEAETSSIYGDIADLQNKIAALEEKIAELNEKVDDEKYSVDYIAAGYTLPRRAEDFESLIKDASRKINEEEKTVSNETAEGDDGSSNGEQHSAHYIRHSASNYKTIIKQKEAGMKGFDPKDQVFPDLSEPGIELAKKEAEEFFQGLDSEKDVLFFASSNEARALATADIYRQEAKKRNFEIMKPGKTNLALSDKETDGYVRMSSMLSLNPRSYLEHSIFVSSLPEVVQKSIAEKLPEELRERWLAAREIINNAPDEIKKGGFGTVYHTYADQIKKLFPDVRNAEQMEKRFQHIVELAQWGMEKAKESGLEKNLKILGFGHENYASPVLEKYFGDHSMKNCEALNIKTATDGKMELERRGEKSELEA